MPDPIPLARGRNATVVPWMLGLSLAILALWTLRAASSVAVPIVVAILLIIALRPFDAWLAARLPGRAAWLSRVVVMACVLGVVCLFVAGLVVAAQQLLGALPDLSETVENWANRVRDAASAASQDTWVGEFVGDITGVLGNVAGSVGSGALDAAGSFARTLVSTTGGFVAGLVIVFFLVLLGLGEAPTWTRKFDSTAGSRTARDAWRDTVRIVSENLRRFVVVRTAIGLITAALYTAWLALFGIDLLLVWAIFALLLTFIPNLGSVISGTLPALYALLTADFGTAVLVAAGLIAIEQVIGNFVDPRMQGRRIAVSPLTILVALLIWGWIWGVAGALLATPITIAMVATFHHIRPLRPLAVLLSNQPDAESLDRVLAA